jgi:hypothetical protein
MLPVKRTDPHDLGAETPSMTTDHDAATSLTAAIATVHEGLSPCASAVYSILDLLPGGIVSLELIVAATNLGTDEAVEAAAELTDASLLDPAGDSAYRVPSRVLDHLLLLPGAPAFGGAEAVELRIMGENTTRHACMWVQPRRNPM